MTAKESLIKKDKLSYSLQESAEATGYSVRTIQNHMADGNIIGRYANSKCVILAEDLKDWLLSLPTEKPD
ncbi:hypothetical protein ACT3UQ_08985 [Glutamicibacter sp. AOP12-B1-11]|uniref:hypothetical protein n=1 Tax=Glutamicibacter sp. AOP12-B1-11 TaxID=3457725 RepID=UPI0040347D49